MAHTRKLIYRFIAACTVCFTAVLLFSCSRENSCESCYTPKKPPFAVAGPDQLISLPLDSVELNGSASTDPDGTIANWRWKKISGPDTFLVRNPQMAVTRLIKLVAGIYRFELQVTDNDGLSSRDTLLIQVNQPVMINRPPIARAGSDRLLVLPQNSLTLDGSASSDPDNNIAAYAWTQISGSPSVIIANAAAVQTRVENLPLGTQQFELKVTDSLGLFSKDTIRVQVNPDSTPPPPQSCGSNRPVVNAQLVPVGTLSKPRISVAVASANNKILFAGGLEENGNSVNESSRVDIYDIITQTWSTAELSKARYQIAAATAANKIFFAGGEAGDGTSPVNTVDIYDAVSNTWSVAQLSAPGNSIAAASVGNKVLFAGGDGGFTAGGGVRGNTVDIFDVSTNTWSVAALTESKYGISAATLNNKVYFSGGFSFPVHSKKIEVFDNSTNTWSIDTMFEAKSFHGGIAINDRLIWAGGMNNSGNSSCLVDIKNKITGNRSIEYLIRPEEWIGCQGEHLVTRNNRVIFYRTHNTDRDKFDIYDVNTNTWSVGVLPQPLPAYASILCLNNTIYIAGGSTNSGVSNQVWKLEF